MEDRLHTVCGDLTDKVSGTFQLICANIVADVIIRLCPVIPRFLAPGGVFIASGIIDERIDDVRAALAEAGLSIEEQKESGGWCALSCRCEER